ncbi:3D domain-containing protein [Mangrovimonas aestuarii]|uniref:3D domain-containing protein n=1 Tax=Mangrovimonas aestuarii TaxID=3018443 RepID=UPI00237854AF|nr:hypothetical protein [Mangrovimonas aestuarii]
MGKFIWISLVIVFGLVDYVEAPRKTSDTVKWKSIEVMASAYNSVESQTNEKPNLSAWGDTISPGDKIIAVSRDLIDLGLGHNTKVKIEGFDGVYLVKDKMHSRWTKHIDIYMGNNVDKAKEWGRRKVTIEYEVD